MSYDLAVWEGERPAGDAAAHREFRRLYDRFIGRDLQPPTPRIAGYVRALLDRYPEDDTPEGEASWHAWTTPSGRTYTQEPWRYTA